MKMHGPGNIKKNEIVNFVTNNKELQAKPVSHMAVKYKSV
jgi:hypothetical protein